jgi:pyruvate formate lyase activating enzyme
MDAVNVDLKGFSDDFYLKLCGAHLQPVLDTLVWLRHETQAWLELTTLLIPGQNDSDAELTALSRWVRDELGEETPLHFSAFHPDFKMSEIPPTPPATLGRARRIAREIGLKHVYTGNVHDVDGDTTRCTGCGKTLIVRDWYEILSYRLDAQGRCPDCGTPLAGRFGAVGAARGEAFGAHPGRHPSALSAAACARALPRKPVVCNARPIRTPGLSRPARREVAPHPHQHSHCRRLA